MARCSAVATRLALQLVVVLGVGAALACPTGAATHWVVTENGRIEAQMDTVFHLRRPYDLMALLEQEKRADLVENLRKELMQQKEDIDRKEDKETDLEARLQRTEPDCIAVGKPLVEFDLYVSTVIRGSHNVFALGEMISGFPEGHFREPFCTSAVPLDFSMHAFEHLDAMKTRGNLSMESEEGLLDLVYKRGKVHEYGHQIALLLETDPLSWVAFNQAAVYWRIQGDVFHAIECVRRALHFSPREHKSIALVSLGNVLHRTRNSEAAALVLHAAVDHSPDDPVTHFTLGNIYAVLADYNRSITCYENVMRLKSEYVDQAKQRKHAVLCHKKLEQALETQHKSLQKTLSELRKYQEQYEQWLMQQNKLLQGRVPFEERITSRLKYKEAKWKSSPLGEDCFEYQENGLNIISCNMKQHFLPEIPASSMLTDVALNLESLLKNVESKAERLSEQVVKKGAGALSSDDQVDVEEEDEEEEDFVPTFPAKYFPAKYVPGRVTMGGWPNKGDCQFEGIKLPAKMDMPSVFLPPENKGYDVASYLGIGIGLGPNEEHPLPWYPPICEKLASGSTEYDYLEGIKGRAKVASKASETKLSDHLMGYINGDANSAEVGQRILTAIKKRSGPSWLLQVLASFYWRVHGNLYNSVECLRHAVLRVPTEFKDVALVNLAAILDRNGEGEEAMMLLEEAFQLNPYEPSTNTLIGNLLALAGNNSGSVEHYKRVLEVEPEDAEVRRTLKSLGCSGMEEQEEEEQVQEEQEQEQEQEEEEEKENDEVEGEGDTSSVDKCISSSPLSGNSLDTLLNTAITPAPCRHPVEEVGVLRDGPLPDMFVQIPDMTWPAMDCQGAKKIEWKQFTSTWLSVSTKGIDMSQLLGPALRDGHSVSLKPRCQADFPASMATLDHLSGVRHRDQLKYGAEAGLKEAFQSLAGDGVHKVDDMATRVAIALQKDPTSWVLTTAAALYWRITGDGSEAVTCLRQALHYAPRNMKDVALVSLANVFHRSELYNNALVAANMALEVSPKFVVIHFTMANIYAAKGDLELAMVFYASTLALQSSFEPARERLRSIQCSITTGNKN